ncbi:MAG: helix-turn-helix transcriptional regulator [Clostridia bacterium]|nr:helix-turn-helix transcriptional regulator [Clostridia bacterium]
MENSELIRKAVEYAKQNAASPKISVQEVASNAGFSMDYFNRVFLSHTGFTVMAYVHYIRLMNAAVLLRNTDKSVLEIALESGYDSHEGFTKAFKKNYGLVPSEYRSRRKSEVVTWSELVDCTVAARFVHDNPGLELVDTADVIDYLLKKDAKRYSYFCTTIKYMGLAVAAPGGDIQNGFIGIGDDRKGGCYLELMTDDFTQLAQWLQRFSGSIAFYSAQDPLYVKDMLATHGLYPELRATPQALYLGEPMAYTLPEDIQIRLLSGDDKDSILKWANGRNDGYIWHLLTASHYEDPSVLEYGVFREDKLIAVAGGGIDEVRGVRLNNCCNIRFAAGEADDELYHSIFAFVVNAVIEWGALPFDDLQHGEYARTHGGFTAEEVGFETVNWRYDIL